MCPEPSNPEDFLAEEPVERKPFVLRYEGPSLILVFGPPGFAEDLARRVTPFEAVVGVDREDFLGSTSRIDAVTRRRGSAFVDCSALTKRERQAITRLCGEQDTELTALMFEETKNTPYPPPGTAADRRAYAQYRRTRDDLFVRTRYSHEGFASLQVLTPVNVRDLERIEFA